VSAHDLEELRARIRALDLELIERVAERQELARLVGELKRREGRPTVDFEQERVVLDRIRDAARMRGVDEVVAEELLGALIRASVTAQDEDSLRASALGAGRTAVVVGGAGRMGRWFVRFLSAQGYVVTSLDPAGSPEETAAAGQLLPLADLIVCSTTPAVTARLYAEWTTRVPAGVIVDIASIKSPLVAPIAALRAAGARVASIHPLFGPSTVLLREADVVVCDTGDAAASAAIEALFKPTTARVVHLSLADHDRIMADLLSLAHAAAIAFALALPAAEHPVRSTTFRALEELAAAVVRESPDVYFEIQASNPHSAAALARLREAIDRVAAAVAAGDAGAFRDLLLAGQSRTSSRGRGGM